MYFSSVLFVGLLVYGVITALLITQLIKIGIKWVNDEDEIFIPINGTERIVKYIGRGQGRLAGVDDPPGRAIARTYALAYLVAFPVVVLWVIGVPGILVIGGLFSLRGFIRLKKKIDRVIKREA